jgi:hypothetical protein
MKLKLIKNIYKGLVYSLMLCPFAVSSAFFVNVSDTLSGDEASLQLSGLNTNERLTATIERPNAANINLNFQADSNGNIQSEIYGLHLKTSGTYTLRVSRENLPNVFESQVFEVLPGAPSRFRSSITTTVPTLPADGVALSPLRVQVKDAYGNPVPGQNVQVFSSRNEDVINIAGLTDQQGIVSGTVFSTTPGVSILSALVNEEMFFERTEIVFHLPATSNGAMGQSGIGRFLKAQLFTDDFEEVAYLSIEGLPSEVLTEEGYTFTVLAKDTNGNVVKNYEGQVRFSSNDSGGQFPVDYSFTRSDQGEHEFAVAAAFSTPGKRTLTVTDLADSSIQGQVELNVVSRDRVVEPPVGDALVILTPNEGTFSSPRMTITGRGEPGVPIKITDGPTVLVEDLSLDINGDFFYQTPALADGRHVFRAELMDGSVFSNVVEVRIDNTPPRVLAVEVNPPNGVPAGGVFGVTVSSNEPLSTATCTFRGESTALNRSGDVFVGDINAGTECGTVPLSCTVADILGNELQENTAATIQVCGNEPVAPEPTNDTDLDGLTDADEGRTEDEDDDGVPDYLESNLVDSTGNGIVDQKDPTNDTDRGGKNNITEKNEQLNPLVPADDVVANLPPTSVSSLSATPGEERVTLMWSPARDDKGIGKYRIEFGESPDAIFSVNMTPDNRTQWYVDKLRPATKYYFRVVAIDADGNEGVNSNLVEATTFGEIFQSAAVPESGSADNIWLPLLLSFFGGILFIMFGRRKA